MGVWGSARRCLLLCLLVLSALATCPSLVSANPIQAENALVGGNEWERARGPLGVTSAIEGYTSTTSAAPGETINFHVSTSAAASYRIEIHRLGWYGGTGGRRHLCLPDPDCVTDKAGVEQPAPPEPDANGKVEVDWTVTDSLVIPDDWVSGYYVAELILTSGPESGKRRHVQFTVKAPAAQPTAMVVMVPVNTIQAYNNWGGKSLYDSGSTNGERANRVSFDRPTAPQDLSSDLFRHEYQLVRFLEREGYDVSYVTAVDVHRDPGLLLDHRMAITAGHSEYWTKQMRDGFDAARDAGVHLTFMGSNTAYWQIRYEDNERTIVGYKDFTDPHPDPELTTVKFRQLATPRPECELMGVMFQGGHRISGSDPPRDYAPVPAALGDPLMQGTGFTAATTLPRLVGYEWDAVKSDCSVPTVTPLLHWEGMGELGPSSADAVHYTATSGAQVFSTGSLQFTWGIDDYAGGPEPAIPGLQQLVRNVLAASGAQGSPHAVTGGSSATGESSATLEGTVNPNLDETTYSFEYGPTSAYGSETSAAGAGAGGTAQNVSAVLSGLLSGTTYHYRLVATNASGTSTGADATFTTSQGGPTMSIGTDPVRLAKRGVAPVLLTCHHSDLDGVCTGVLSLKTAKRVRHKGKRKVLLGRRAFQVEAGATRRVKVPLSRGKAALVNRLGALPVLGTISSSDLVASATTIAQRFKLKAPRGAG